MKFYSKIYEATVWPVLVVMAGIISACTLFVVGSSFLESIMIDNPVSPQESGGFKIWLIDKLVFLAGIAGVAIYAQKKLHENTVRRDSRDIHIAKYEKIIELIMKSKRDLSDLRYKTTTLSSLAKIIDNTRETTLVEIENITTSFSLPTRLELHKLYSTLTEKKRNSLNLSSTNQNYPEEKQHAMVLLEGKDCIDAINSFINVIKGEIQREKRLD